MKNPKQYDLEKRTFEFARNVRILMRKLPRDICNIEDGKQLVRSSGSTGANYIEANESLSKKDFSLRIKICRKESKESQYWLNLLFLEGELDKERNILVDESMKLTKIFGSILEKTK